MKEPKYYIYAHFTKDTNELFYIGIGKGNRKDVIFGRNKYWNNIVIKHGYTSHIIIDRFISRNEAVKEEIRLQILNKPKACLQYGDTNNKIISIHTRYKQRLSAISRGANNKGCKRSEEHKLSVSMAQRGNTHRKGLRLSIDSIKKMKKTKRAKQPYFIAIDDNNQVVYRGNSQLECANLLFNNRNAQSKIRECLIKIRKTHKKHKFSYLISTTQPGDALSGTQLKKMLK